MPSTPYVLGVQVNQSGGSPRANVTVKITNKRTKETQTSTTNSSGQSAFDLANFEQGYIVGDAIDIEKQVADTDMEYYVSANGDETVPSWVQVSNKTRTRIFPSSARIKLNLTRNPGGMQVNFTLD